MSEADQFEPTPEPPDTSAQTMSPAEAVADIRELRKGLTLGGLRVKDLINEGRKH